MKKIKQPHGGALLRLEKGETSNPNGRPRVPKTIKEFIKELENVETDILIPVEACEKIIKGDKEFYKVKNTSGHKMAMSAYNKAMKGDIRFLDWLTKMGYAGGYEPAKTQNQNINIPAPKGKIEV